MWSLKQSSLPAPFSCCQIPPRVRTQQPCRRWNLVRRTRRYKAGGGSSQAVRQRDLQWYHTGAIHGPIWTWWSYSEPSWGLPSQGNKHPVCVIEWHTHHHHYHHQCHCQLTLATAAWSTLQKAARRHTPNCGSPTSRHFCCIHMLMLAVWMRKMVTIGWTPAASMSSCSDASIKDKQILLAGPPASVDLLDRYSNMWNKWYRLDIDDDVLQANDLRNRRMITDTCVIFTIARLNGDIY